MLAALSLGAHAETLPADSARITPTVKAVSSVVPAVVNISTERVIRVSDPFESFFNEFFGGTRYYRESIPLGSGVIVDASGLILTNYHVIQRASEIHVHLWNGESYTARYVAGDSTNDLALLQLREDLGDTELQPIKMARPNDLILGETVIAVGNPFGLENSVTSGVLSAMNRSFDSDEVVFNDILQTDAAINPGNSGGPLINLDGELIGINLAIRADAQGIGFAIPLARAEEVLARWLVPSRFSLASCGFVPATRVNEKGEMSAVVAEVTPNSGAQQAGLTPDTVITTVNGIEVERAVDVGRILWQLKQGDTATVTTGANTRLQIAVKEMTPETLVRQRLGLQLQVLTAPLLEALGLPETLRGLAISEVLEESSLADYNVARGDILFRIGETDVESIEDIYNVLKNKRAGDSLPVFLVVSRQFGGRRYLRQSGVTIRLN